jgi:ATP-dependent DNA helicase RecQ
MASQHENESGEPRRRQPKTRRKFALPTGKALKALLGNFGIERLRPGQKDVIESVLGGRDTLAILPTGGGKSLCYQIPALVMPGTTVVVSPLISLMKDQVEKLENAGVDAEQVNSSLNTCEEERALLNIEKSRSEIVFVTPERLEDEGFVKSLQALHIDLFVLDEAHCISQWGHDFRPAFLGLSNAIRKLGRPPVLALTATATEEVAKDICEQLGLRKPRIVNNGIHRPNLRYEVIHVTNEEEKLARALQLAKETPGSGIVYAATVKAVELLYQQLREAGVSVARYHGKLPAGERKENQERFMDGRCRVMVATNAFGMGIDKPDTRFVIHYQLPANLEAYYQESGRAGRDGDEARCILLYFAEDKRVQQFFLAKYVPSLAELQAVYQALQTRAAQEAPIRIENLKSLLREMTGGKLKVALILLKEARLLRQTRDGVLHLLALEPGRLEQAVQAYEDRHEHEREALERMVGYAQSGFCRWKVLMTYFGEEDFGSCGHCDNCLHPPSLHLEETHVNHKGQAQSHEKQEGGSDAPEPIQVGALVNVPKYDRGQVVSLTGDQVTVVFPDNATRTFLKSFVTLLDR